MNNEEVDWMTPSYEWTATQALKALTTAYTYLSYWGNKDVFDFYASRYPEFPAIYERFGRFVKENTLAYLMEDLKAHCLIRGIDLPRSAHDHWSLIVRDNERLDEKQNTLLGEIQDELYAARLRARAIDIAREAPWAGYDKASMSFQAMKGWHFHPPGVSAGDNIAGFGFRPQTPPDSSIGKASAPNPGEAADARHGKMGRPPITAKPQALKEIIIARANGDSWPVIAAAVEKKFGISWKPETVERYWRDATPDGGPE